MKKSPNNTTTTKSEKNDKKSSKMEIPPEFFSNFADCDETDEKVYVKLDLSALIDRLIRLEEELQEALKNQAEAAFTTKSKQR